jgi:hypothetical protein
MESTTVITIWMIVFMVVVYLLARVVRLEAEEEQRLRDERRARFEKLRNNRKGN